MKNLIQSILSIAFLFVLGFQLSAQCIPSTLNKGSVKGAGHVFSGESFGQSVKPSACAAGSKFESFTFWAQGNSPTKMGIKVYKGEGTSGQLVYEKDNIQSPPTNFGGPLPISLSGGTEHGTGLTIQSGTTYTFMMTIPSSGGGNLIAHVTSGTSGDGRVYFNASRRPSAPSDANLDLRYEVKTGAAAATGVIVYEADSYRRASKELAVGNYPNPASFAPVPDNSISSLKVPSGYTVILYDLPNFGGASATITSDVISLGRHTPRFYDKASSIKVIKN